MCFLGFFRFRGGLVSFRRVVGEFFEFVFVFFRFVMAFFRLFLLAGFSLSFVKVFKDNGIILVESNWIFAILGKAVVFFRLFLSLFFVFGFFYKFLGSFRVK